MQVSYYAGPANIHFSNGYDKLWLHHIQRWTMVGCSDFVGFNSIPESIHSDTWAASFWRHYVWRRRKEERTPCNIWKRLRRLSYIQKSFYRIVHKGMPQVWHRFRYFQSKMCWRCQAGSLNVLLHTQMVSMIHIGL